MAKKKDDNFNDGLKVTGMFRVKIGQDGKIVGDSGWKKNQITTGGFNQYLVATLGAIAAASSKQVSYMALGSGSAPGTSDTTLNGELTNTSARASVVAATSATSKTVSFTATFASNTQIVSSITIANIGLFNTSAQNTGQIFAGNTYASSAIASNQNVYATYNINFS